MTPLLDVSDLSIGFGVADPVIKNVTFQVMPGVNVICAAYGR